jgi:hypothetical protein
LYVGSQKDEMTFVVGIEVVVAPRLEERPLQGVGK